MAFYNNKNHTHAFATVLGTMGGFQSQPEWFTSLSESSIWQILMATVLVYQGGGNLDIVYSLCVAIAFFIIIELSRYVSFSKPTDTEEGYY